MERLLIYIYKELYGRFKNVKEVISIFTCTSIILL